jgi:hypothetical protein
MFTIVLAAALTTAAAKPLFVAPAAMHHLKRDPVQAERLARSRMLLLDEYRANVREQVGDLTESRSVVITISIGDSLGMDAASYASTQLEAMKRHSQFHVIAARPATLCNGRRGWLTALTYPGSDQMFERMYADGGDRMYIATLEYPQAVGDTFHAARALQTLCPPQPAVGHEVLSVPFTPPAHWNSGSADSLQVPPEFTRMGAWLHLASHSIFLESVTLVKAPALPDGVTAQQQAQAMIDGTQNGVANFQLKSSRAQKLCNGADGWYVAYSALEGGRAYSVEQMYGFGSEASYILTYTRHKGDPEDASARKSLTSLCPPVTASPSPSPVSKRR